MTSTHPPKKAGLRLFFQPVFLVIILAAIPWQLLLAQEINWSPADIVRQESASQFVFSPDATMVAWVKSRNSSEKDRNVTDLYLTRIHQKTESTDPDKSPWLTLQLTRSEESEHNPFFSTDGTILYYLSSRDDGKKLWAMNLMGGEPYEVHTFEQGIRDIQQLSDGKILFLSEEGDLLIEMERKENKDNTQVIEDSVTFKPSRLFLFDPASKSVRRLTDNVHPIETYAASDDGRWAVTGHIRSTHYGADAQPPPSYYFRDLETGSRVRILHDMQTPGMFRFAGDRRGVYFSAVTSSDPELSGAGISELYYLPIPEDFNASNYSDSFEDEDISRSGNPHPLEPVRVPLDWEWGLGSGYHVRGNDVIASLANGPTRILAYYEQLSDNNWRKRVIDTGRHDERVAIAAVSEDGEKAVYVYSTASTMPQYRLGSISTGRRGARLSEGEHLFRINTALADKYTAQSEIFRWTGAEDTEVNGILYYPKNYDPNRRYPLVVAIRGGPAGVTLDWWNMSWAYFPHILSQKESFVLMPNYHGSSNHGLAFVESIKQRYYELELVDIVNGIDALERSGKIDKDSLGVMGWSNGSILAIELSIEYPDMFKAIGAGAGTVNWVSDYGTCMFGVRFNKSYIGGAPWDSTGTSFYNMTYIEKSPIFRMDRVRTPTIIFFGSEDRAVPRDQGWEHYRALQQSGKAPVRFLWFPGQPHSLQKLTHQRRKLEEEIAWFDRYLFGTWQERNRAFKKDSPLAELFKRDSLASHNGYFGVLKNDLLIPEVVPIGKDTISVGRFTVTNQQFLAYDADHSFHPLHANHPVRYVTLNQARAYTKWLGDQTGEQWRLPNPTEAEALHRTAHRAGPNQNTLNRLAGFDVTVDEASLLRNKARKLPADQLVMASGSFAPVKLGDAEIYDLGGNVTEWFDPADIRLTGEGRRPTDARSIVNPEAPVYGYSAVDYVDADDVSAPNILFELTGFRVIRISF